MARYRIELELHIDAELNEDEMFPDGRPSGLPEGPLDPADVLAYVLDEISTYSDLDDWGLLPINNTISVHMGPNSASAPLRLRS